MPRDAVLHPEFLQDLRYWVDVDRQTALRLLSLMESCTRDPFLGIGKPERLRHLGGNTWSRRLTMEDRVVYVVHDDRVEFVQGRKHY